MELLIIVFALLFSLPCSSTSQVVLTGFLYRRISMDKGRPELLDPTENGSPAHVDAAISPGCRQCARPRRRKIHG